MDKNNSNTAAVDNIELEQHHGVNGFNLGWKQRGAGTLWI